MISIGIPTIKGAKQMLIDIERRSGKDLPFEVFQVYSDASAAKNRNKVIDEAKGDLIIMLDDDISGFYPDWIYDLVTPLLCHRNLYSIVSARLIYANGKTAPQLGGDGNDSGPLVPAIHEPTVLNITCSAAIAFYKSDNIRFDENYIAAVYEDTDFCMQYREKYPDRKIMINNRCRLVHGNEGKRGGIKNAATVNREYFAEKWGIRV